jgi:RimJ/RimL family protein N-acetyltransferase
MDRLKDVVRSSHTPRLVTERLILDPLRPEHADEMVAVLAGPELYAFIGGEPPTLDELRIRYGHLVTGASARTEEWHNWTVRDRTDGTAVGTVQATIFRSNGGAEIAWVIGRAWQGRGYATEAAIALAAWLRRHGLTSIVAHVHPDHRASAAVARRAGLSPTTEFQDRERVWRWPAQEHPPF